MSGIQKITLRHLLELPCPLIKVIIKLQQANSNRTLNGPDSLAVKVWVTKSDEPQLVVMFAEGKGEWIVEKWGYIYQL